MRLWLSEKINNILFHFRYIGGSLGYLGGDCDDAPVHFPSLWKPPGNYFPRGEAPPPYDEAVAQARAEAIR